MILTIPRLEDSQTKTSLPSTIDASVSLRLLLLAVNLALHGIRTPLCSLLSIT